MTLELALQEVALTDAHNRYVGKTPHDHQHVMVLELTLKGVAHPSTHNNLCKTLLATKKSWHKSSFPATTTRITMGSASQGGLHIMTGILPKTHIPP